MDEYRSSADDVMELIADNHKKAQRRDRALEKRLDILAARVKGLYVHLAALSTLIVGDIVARYISAK